MNPFYFGDTGAALYGVHHPPKGSTPRSSGVVLCYPFAQEYMRAHRAFRQLSLLLSAQGFHTLRFDYSGTGDSAGEPEDISLAHWQHDLDTAIEELMDSASVDSVWVVGLRLGGSLAMNAAENSTVRGVVLWDPIINGATQLDGATPEPGPGGDAMLAIGGVPVFPQFRNDLASLDLMAAPLPSNATYLLAVSEDTVEYQGLRDRLTRDGADVTYTCVPSDGRWSLYDNWGSALIPQALIRAIVDHLKGVVK